MKFSVTGGCGFVGTNLSAEILRRGHKLTILDNLSRHGTSENLKWLKTLGEFEFVQADIRSTETVSQWIRDYKPDVIFHLAGQVAMTTSINDPRADFEINVTGSINVLEAARAFAPEAQITYSSTNKVYGDLETLTYEEQSMRYVCREFPEGFDESFRLDFRTPYGCSKGAADQYMLDYARMFGLRTTVFRHSSIYGGRQFSTADQGWIGWFVQQALETRENPTRAPFQISGNGKQVRDVLESRDLVACYFQALEASDRTRGQAYNIGGGVKNSYSLLELFDFLQKTLGVKMNYECLPFRRSDQKIFVADLACARRDFGFDPRVTREAGVLQMIKWVNRCLTPF